ncbi:uncharacterized protein LOC113275113 isoform X1 [Papaver somniferum]|uniref:uncharacterized protein LOC113275113 isoform X1 n=1 Tax=Papaver somniferum TaxID=3469 RepID=UPI000E6FC529|nr:uncharacterized protein LOC113275113 isoform X1 [Papaver somniferum]
MADKSSRSLIIYGDGCVKHISSSHVHLHHLVSRGCSGFLSLAQSPNAVFVMDFKFKHLWSCTMSFAGRLWKEDCLCFRTMKGGSFVTSECSKESSVSTMSDRFMGLKAAIVSTNSNVKSFGRYLGFTVLEFDNLTKDKPSFDEPLACELLKLLGFHGGETLETSEFDLVFVHLGCSEKVNVVKEEGVGNEVEYINSLVGGILQIAQPGSEIASRLHLSVVMSYGASVDDEDSSLLQLNSLKENSNLSLLFPRQSYTMKGANLLNNIRHHSPMLITQWQEAVTRKDMAEKFSFQDIKEKGGNLAIPADRFLQEIAFKLWKAPKYGA